MNSHSKTPGGAGASDKFKKQQAEKHGLGADNAPGHKDAAAPGEAPVAGDSYVSTVGIDNGTNQPGEKGNVGQPVGHMGSETINQGNQK
ncbi:hypothetical protein LTS08_008037 [Lithohypha guttulata]|uniref:Uncharacterized protein n=1 Tax=Lithohypha guttulata TaxID=1690604 RepID=A0AAN7YLD2_9EURO|nr:hypothetical protein LTR51_004609 [Lithohypha guttulata]KAK5091216.1 hypothetical protein LTR05_001397 [Lithohypha guttulata]KAK5095644.1 hypothetical protein LTS08_008037 [Lithohypha guttulata]